MAQTTQEPKIEKPTRLRDWETINHEWQESGLTQKAFCQESKLSLPMFVYHRGKLPEKTRISKRSTSIGFGPVCPNGILAD